MKSPSAQSSQGPADPGWGVGGTKVRYRVNGAPTRAFHATGGLRTSERESFCPLHRVIRSRSTGARASDAGAVLSIIGLFLTIAFMRVGAAKDGFPYWQVNAKQLSSGNDAKSFDSGRGSTHFCCEAPLSNLPARI
jgi:hypothetical protein